MKRKIDKIPDAHYERGYVYNFHFHLIWCTKYRCPCFTTPELVREMKDILQHVADASDITIETMEVMPDHIHLLVSFKPKYAATSVVKTLKGHSARLFLEKHPEIRNAKFWGGKLWSASYYMSTLGNMSKETVLKYINNQYSRAEKETREAQFRP